MPRKRMIDPEFWSDEEIGNWSAEARLFYIGLWNFADDEGRFKAHPKLLKSQIFPYSDRISIEKLLQEINGKVLLYESNGSRYGYLPNFLKHQRIDHPSNSKLPAPRTFTEDSGKVQGTIPPNIIEVKLREYKISASNFSEVWSKYPNRVGRKEAERHFFASVKTKQDLANINKALDNYLKTKKVAQGFIKNGSTWFNNWQDYTNYQEPKTKEEQDGEATKSFFRNDKS